VTDLGLDGMTVYILLSLHLYQSVYIDVSRTDFLATLLQNPEKLPYRWACNGCEVCGYPSQASGPLGPRGAIVAVGSMLPARVPPRFERFFEEQQLDTTHLSLTAPGPVSQTLRLHFAGGRHLLIVDKGSGGYATRIPTRLLGSRPTPLDRRGRQFEFEQSARAVGDLQPRRLRLDEDNG
jgi:hypothetical protein